MRNLSLFIVIILLAGWAALGTVTFSLLLIGLLFVSMTLLPLLQASLKI